MGSALRCESIFVPSLSQPLAIRQLSLLSIISHNGCLLLVLLFETPLSAFPHFERVLLL